MAKKPAESPFEIEPDTGAAEAAKAKAESRKRGVQSISIAIRRIIALAAIAAAIYAGLRFGPKRVAIQIESHAGTCVPLEVISKEGSSTRADGLCDGERSTIFFITFDRGPFDFAIPLEKGGAKFAHCGNMLSANGVIGEYSPFRAYSPIVLRSTKGDPPEFHIDGCDYAPR